MAQPTQLGLVILWAAKLLLGYPLILLSAALVLSALWGLITFNFQGFCVAAVCALIVGSLGGQIVVPKSLQMPTSVSASRSAATVTAFTLEAPIKLETPVRTPLGSAVTSIRPCVDVWCRVHGDEIAVDDVKLAIRGLGSLPVNVVAHRTGEAWLAHESLFSNDQLTAAVEVEIAMPNSSLRKLILKDRPTSKQLAFAGRLNLEITREMTRDEVSELIAQTLNRDNG